MTSIQRPAESIAQEGLPIRVSINSASQLNPLENADAAEQKRALITIEEEAVDGGKGQEKDNDEEVLL